MTKLASGATLATIVLTYNEEIHVARCLESIRKFCDETVFVNSFSTDRTAILARGLGAHVVATSLHQSGASNSNGRSTISP